jgi:uncharacterized RDD family membrane protein YckC
MRSTGPRGTGPSERWPRPNFVHTNSCLVAGPLGRPSSTPCPRWTASPSREILGSSELGSFDGHGAPMNNLATFWQRFLAMLVDILVFVPLGLLQWGLESSSKVAALVMVIPYAALAQAYSIYGHGRFGRTVGKWVMGIRVVRVTGDPLRWREAWLRSAVDLCLAAASNYGQFVALMAITDAEYYVGWSARGANLAAHQPVWARWALWVAMVWVCSEVLTMLFNKRRRALHDFIAGTVVISDPRQGPSIAPASSRP